ncbi:MAG: DUF1934 domain-containing protein [Oscillospiraceae bacterium]|nr:DUF1934 domain-containing protein [Oscillospiraceae bacterium]
MKQNVLILIRGTQTTPGSEPETIELTTAGVMEREGETVTLSYQESPLTGLAGTTTVFRVEPGKITLERTGAVESVMEFVEGQVGESLYRIEEGALLLRVLAKKMDVDLQEDHGVLHLCYAIEIENTPMGTIDYHITVKPA